MRFNMGPKIPSVVLLTKKLNGNVTLACPCWLDGPLAPMGVVSSRVLALAMLAWFAVVISGIKRTAWKYAFVALIMFGVFQPFVWTKMAPWLWAVAGASTASAGGPGYIFKEA